METWHYPLLTCVGLLAGWINVMAGGGSLLTLPVMLFVGMPGPVANGTNRIAILAQNLSAIASFHRRGFSDFRLSLTLALAAMPGALLGALAGVKLEGEWFERVLAGVMLGVMIIMVRHRKSPVTFGEPLTPRRWWLGHLGMFAAGIWGGFIQIGVGFILMPILNRVMGLDLVRVNMHKVFIVLCYSLVALAVFASQVRVMWGAGACLALGNALGGWIGAHTAATRGEGLIRWVLNGLLLLFVIKLLFF